MPRALPLVLTVLTACAADPEDATGLPADVAGPPGLTLEVDPFVPGQPATLRVTGAPARARVQLIRGAAEATNGWCPAVIAPDCLDLALPAARQFTVRADAAGEADLTFTVPAWLPPGEVTWQAALLGPAGFDKSPPVTVPISDPTLDGDDDGLSTADELTLYGTDPANPDSDGGGYTDGREIADGTDPLDAADDGPPLDVTTLQPGDLVITEIMKDPTASPDGNGEWFELYNPSGAPIDLDGLNLSDDGANNAPIRVTRIVPAASYVVIAVQADPAINGGLNVLHAWTGQAFVLDNTADEIVLETPAGDVIDRVAYEAVAPWPSPTGASLSLDPALRDAVSNDAGVAWCTTPAGPYGAGDLGSPGAPNPPCP